MLEFETIFLKPIENLKNNSFAIHLDIHKQNMFAILITLDFQNRFYHLKKKELSYKLKEMLQMASTLSIFSSLPIT